jgi:hypothetical protein
MLNSKQQPTTMKNSKEISFKQHKNTVMLQLQHILKSDVTVTAHIKIR